MMKLSKRWRRLFESADPKSVVGQFPHPEWGDELAQLETDFGQLRENNKFLAETAAKAAAKNVQIDGLAGYTCILESMLRKREVKLPPRPSLMKDIYQCDEDTESSEEARVDEIVEESSVVASDSPENERLRK